MGKRQNGSAMIYVLMALAGVGVITMMMMRMVEVRAQLLKRANEQDRVERMITASLVKLAAISGGGTCANAILRPAVCACRPVTDYNRVLAGWYAWYDAQPPTALKPTTILSQLTPMNDTVALDTSGPNPKLRLYLPDLPTAPAPELLTALNANGLPAMRDMLADGSGPVPAASDKNLASVLIELTEPICANNSIYDGQLQGYGAKVTIEHWRDHVKPKSELSRAARINYSEPPRNATVGCKIFGPNEVTAAGKYDYTIEMTGPVFAYNLRSGTFRVPADISQRYAYAFPNPIDAPPRILSFTGDAGIPLSFSDTSAMTSIKVELWDQTLPYFRSGTCTLDVKLAVGATDPPECGISTADVRPWSGCCLYGASATVAGYSYGFTWDRSLVCGLKNGDTATFSGTVDGPGGSSYCSQSYPVAGLPTYCDGDDTTIPDPPPTSPVTYEQPPPSDPPKPVIKEIVRFYNPTSTTCAKETEVYEIFNQQTRLVSRRTESMPMSECK